MAAASAGSDGSGGGAADAVIVVALLLVAVSATAAVATREPARQALVLSVLGIVLAVLFTVLQAPDVGLSQLAVGSALTPLLIMLSVRKVRRRGRTKDGAE
ncbi:hydrogenase subunit MbhD domain-containing protein [Streptomyces sp. L2]|uniref:Na(+)/H(+) antiporter subunit B n=1 Tax=Streptomyces sp. L2 TaxID=2162665 RepID=UPI00101159D5|nr:hydrogenase subunit MbhD domain-containing protein [Streptomyces sp. L2]